jgi:hypothetical protein
MGHIDYKRTTRAEATPPEWLTIGAQVGELVNQLAGRFDVVAYVGPNAGNSAPACFIPNTAEVELNVEKTFGAGVTPEDIGDIRERDNQFSWPKAVGAIFHEALHARYSQWDIAKSADDLGDEDFFWLTILEEGRIESFGTRTMPHNSGFLRASALGLALGDVEELGFGGSETRDAALLAGLALARVDAGVLTDDDVDKLNELIASKLGDKTLVALRDLWLAAQAYDNHSDASGLYDIAREWSRLVREQAEENGEDPNQGAGAGAPGGLGDLGEFAGELLEALEEAGELAEIGAFGDLDDQQTSEEWKKEAKSRTQHSKQMQEHRKEADEVFGKGTGPMPDAKTWSRLKEERIPTGPERSAAVKVAQLLEKAKYRERDAVEVTSIVPPGRLRTRAMVQGAALKSKGVMTQVEPWRRTARKHVDDPTLTLGVLVDISGSMGKAMEPMATTAWVMSEAVKRVQGRAAMVYFGESVFPTLKPGQHLDKVQVYTAPDGTEKFNKAFKALDGALNLLNGTGARLLVVVSDGCYTMEEEQQARKWVTACESAGVGVLWLSIDDGHTAKRITKSSPSAVLLPRTTDPVSVATEIGQAAARALTAAS